MCSATACCAREHVKLVAAFDHRHIFIDPDPDPAASFAERKRLFALPRSSWADYDSSLLSTGGGVYPRTLKTIEISPEACKRLGADQHHVHAQRADVDHPARPGRSAVERRHRHVRQSLDGDQRRGRRSGQRRLRVNGDDLRCRMVGEGGNLGLTQRGRIEFALNGGLVNTDAIDNSAGVDCSDHEVNIKILLGAAMDEGR